jgi:hypothetical protein
MSTVCGMAVAGPALAAERCAVVEVAPGVKKRSEACSNPFRQEFAPARRVDPYPSGSRPAVMRYGETEIRTGGSVRLEMQTTRP